MQIFEPHTVFFWTISVRFGQMKQKKGLVSRTLELSQSLSLLEEKVLLKFIRAFEEVEKKDSKTEKLFFLMKANASEKKMCKELGVSIGALRKLSERLYEKILETLILNINVDRKGEYSKVALANIKARKYFIAANLLPKKRKLGEAERLLDKCISICEKYELYDTWLEALYFQQRIDNAIQGAKNLLKYQLKIEHIELIRSVNKKADYYNLRITGDICFKSFGNVKDNTILQDYLNDIEPYVSASDNLKDKFSLSISSMIVKMILLILKKMCWNTLSFSKKHPCCIKKGRMEFYC